MPSISGWALRPGWAGTKAFAGCFYALDFGLGFATCRLFLARAQAPRFYALDFGLGFATDQRWRPS